MKKLSFILPVYNVEPYLEKCIRSLRDINMPYSDYEIIVINDGSPDNSEALVRNLQKEIPNIQLINQSNAGVSSARNRGIKVANGEYLIFIDTDDYVNPNMFKMLYERATKDNLDILQSGRSLVKPNGKVIQMLGFEAINDKIFEGINAFFEKDKKYQFFDSSVGYLYRRNLIVENKIEYPIGVVHLEDGVFLRKVFTLAKRVGFENCDFYQVFERPGSASRSKIGISFNAVQGDIISIKNLMLFKNEHRLKLVQTKFMNTSILKYTMLPLMRAINAKDITALYKYYKLLRREDIIPVCTDKVLNSEYLKYAKALNKSIWLFALIYSYTLLKKSFKAKIA